MIKLRPSIEICRQVLGHNVKGAEIGVLGGTNAKSMLMNFPGLKELHLVDSYGGIKETDAKFQEFKLAFVAWEELITWHIKTSMEALGDIEDGSLDFVYIDANHRYFEVYQDIEGWYKKIRKGGVVCGHDYFTYGSVVKAVDDWTKANNLFLFSTKPDWWVFKE